MHEKLTVFQLARSFMHEYQQTCMGAFGSACMHACWLSSELAWAQRFPASTLVSFPAGLFVHECFPFIVARAIFEIGD